MGREWNGPVQSLRDAARARVFLWFFCRVCGHHGRFRPEAMVQITRRDMTLDDLATHLKCRNCGAFRAIVFSSDTNYPGRD